MRSQAVAKSSWGHFGRSIIVLSWCGRVWRPDPACALTCALNGVERAGLRATAIDTHRKI
jgi:hypothetical protein